MFCDSLRYFTMSFDGFSFKDVAGCFNKKRDRAVYYWVLTEINDKSIMQNDKRSCHYNNEGCQIDNKSCHMEVWYDTAKSSEGTGRAALGVNQQEMGRLCGVSRQTISLIERGDYSPSVTLALTIAKVCGVTVEEVFYLQEEDNDGK